MPSSASLHASFPQDLNPDRDSPLCNPLMLPSQADVDNYITSSLITKEEGFEYFVDEETEELAPGDHPPQPLGTTITAVLNRYDPLHPGSPHPTEAQCFEGNSPPTIGTVATLEWRDYTKMSPSELSLLIKGELGQLRPKFIKYHLFHDEPYILATNGPNKPIFATPLFVVPIAGLVPPYPHDSLLVLVKDLPLNPVITSTLKSLRDPSIIAEVHCLRVLQTKEEFLVQKRRDLDDLKAMIDGIHQKYQMEAESVELQRDAILSRL
jgi:hypothetical protein